MDCNVCQDCETCAKLLAEHNNAIVNDILYMLNNPRIDY